jgi:hypothetical protein
MQKPAAKWPLQIDRSSQRQGKMPRDKGDHEPKHQSGNPKHQSASLRRGRFRPLKLR